MAGKEGLIKFDHPKNQSSIIKVLGIGGGGSNAVNHMYRQGIHGVDFVICNTDAQAISESPVPVKIQLGRSLTNGNGAGSRPEVGMNAAIENLEDIREVLSKDTRMVFITAGMGGGTGTGGAPIIAKLAKEMEILTIGIVTIPFSFEGRKRRLVAEEGIQEMRKHVDTLLVINNDKMRELHGNLELAEAFAKADNILTEAAKGIAEIITHVGYINVDFEDVKTVMKDSGVAIMGTGIASGENRAIMAVEDALSSPLLNDNQITGASNVLLYISSGTKGIKLDEVTEITDYIQEEAGSNAEIIWGNGNDTALGENIAVTIIATGFTANQGYNTNTSQKTSTNVIVGKLDPSMERTAAQSTLIGTEEEPRMITRPQPVQFDPLGMSPGNIMIEETEPNTISTRASDDAKAEKEKDPALVQPVAMTYIDLNPEENTRPVNPSGTSGIDFQQKQQDRNTKLRDLSMKIQSPEGLSEIETNPAFVRKNVQFARTHHSDESEVSRYSLNEGEEPNISSNTFLHSSTD